MRGDADPDGCGGARAGTGIVRASVVTTAVFVVTTVAAVSAEAARPVAVAAALVFFAAGTVACLAAVVVAAGRSRSEELAVGSIFLFQGDAPRSVRRTLLGLTAVQTAVGLAAAIARPYSSLAFGLLVPLLGLGLAGLWGARHGAYPRRVDQRRPARPGS